jgi:superfamily II DNA helicase RecQ
MASNNDFVYLFQEVSERISETFKCKLRLKDEQRLAITSLLNKKDVFAVLPTGFGKSLIYQYFVFVKERLSSTATTASVLIIFPLSGLIQDQIVEAKSLGLTAKYLGKMLDGESEAFDDQLPQLIFAMAEDVQCFKFQNYLKDETKALHNNLELLVVDESHTVEIWKGKR